MAGKTAGHRLPTGAYVAVEENPSSMRPRNEAEPEPGALFRPAGSTPGRAAQDTSHRTGSEPPAGPSAAKQAPGSAGTQQTVKVEAVRPPQAPDATVVSPLLPGGEMRAEAGHPDGSGDEDAEPERSDRPTSPSRSG